MGMGGERSDGKRGVTELDRHIEKERRAAEIQPQKKRCWQKLRGGSTAKGEGDAITF